MSNVNTVISFEQLVRDFDSMFQHRVFRLERLNYYYVENEREPYARFLAGEPADWTWREPWKRLVRGVRASGRIMQRVHIVREPVSDYNRFEMLHVYPANVDAGEDVRILPTGRVPAEQVGPIVILGDYWLFDDDRAVRLIYDHGGKVDRVELTDDQDILELCVRLRQDALGHSIPLAKYVAKHNITERKHAA